MYKYLKLSYNYLFIKFEFNCVFISVTIVENITSQVENIFKYLAVGQF